MSKIIELKNIKKALNTNLKIPLVIVFKCSTEEEYDFLINKTSDLLGFYLSLEKKINYFSTRHLENTIIRKVLNSQDFQRTEYKDRAINFLYNLNYHHQFEKMNFENFEILCKKNSEPNIIFIDDLFLFSRKSLWPYIKKSLLIERIKKQKNNHFLDIIILMNNLVKFSIKQNYKHIILLQDTRIHADKSQSFSQLILSHSDICIDVNKNIETGYFELCLKKSRIKI